MITWQQIKGFSNSLNEEQLKEQVGVWLEDDVILGLDTDVLEEDHYYDIGYPEEGNTPKSCIEDFDPEIHIKCMNKGFPRLVKRYWEEDNQQ